MTSHWLHAVCYILPLFDQYERALTTTTDSIKLLWVETLSELRMLQQFYNREWNLRVETNIKKAYIRDMIMWHAPNVMYNSVPRNLGGDDFSRNNLRFSHYSDLRGKIDRVGQGPRAVCTAYTRREPSPVPRHHEICSRLENPSPRGSSFVL